MRIFLVEDDEGRHNRKGSLGVSAPSQEIKIKIHKILKNKTEVVSQKTYRERELRKKFPQGGKVAAAVKMLGRLGVKRKGAVVVAGPAYGSSRIFIKALLDLGFDFVTELGPKTKILIAGRGGKVKRELQQLLSRATLERFTVLHSVGKEKVLYTASELGEGLLGELKIKRLFVAQIGGINEVHSGTIFGATSNKSFGLNKIIAIVSWARWIRPLVRSQEKLANNNGGNHKGASKKKKSAHALKSLISNSHSKTYLERHGTSDTNKVSSREVFSSLKKINIVELFAGAGGMGLGFLLASHYRNVYQLAFSAEVNPIYVETLNRNHAVFKSIKRHKKDSVPDNCSPLDLRPSKSLELIKAKSKEFGGVQLLIGGPPCQGFSSANRNSWNSANPNNRLIDVFVKAVEILKPMAFLMENVQGILWTPHRNMGLAAVAEHVSQKFHSAGYLIFPKIVDAAWYGVPQHRNRFFLLGLRTDLGYRKNDFGVWGPFPEPTHGLLDEKPFITVREAISDLPRIGNGFDLNEMPYKNPLKSVLDKNPFLKFMREGASEDVILDHVTSRHAEYVIKRYKKIPSGGNWKSISNMLTNYSNVKRTHSNIYRRLSWDEPSITIGHYRKSMLVHPSQSRGLSLREASRLQSFPDWFSFSGSTNGDDGGLVYKQQQLANAVCPLVTKAMAEFISGL